MQLTAEGIAQLAPDEKSLSAARQSMSPRLWSDQGLSPEAVWGRCQGSTRYDVAIDLANFAYRCNCPSRKRPCRHVLGLLLMLALEPGALPDSIPPEHVEDWLKKRREKAEKNSSPPARSPREPDAAGQQKRALRRGDRIEQGIVQLQDWLQDLVRNGLAGLESQAGSQFEHQARRLVDAQAGGLANQIRRLGEIPASSPDWPQRLMSAMGRLALLLEAHQRLGRFPHDLQSEIRQLIGWTVSQQELEKEGELVCDDWICIGQKEEELDRLRMQWTWLLGQQSQRVGMILQFTPLKHPFAEAFTASVQQMSLLFYPGVTRVRAKVVHRGEAVPFSGPLPAGHETLGEVLDFYADQLAQMPWRDGTVFVLKTATLSTIKGLWFLRDSTGAGVPLQHLEPWRLLAETGGTPVEIAFEWNGVVAVPLSIVIRNQVVLV